MDIGKVQIVNKKYYDEVVAENIKLQSELDDWKSAYMILASAIACATNVTQLKKALGEAKRVLRRVDDEPRDE